MKKLLIFVSLVCLTGCAPDPMRSAQATERTNASAITVNQSNAQITQAQRDAEAARTAQERLQALQAQQAIVQGQAAIAQANAQAQINASNNATLLAVAAQMAEANKPDYTPLAYMVLVIAMGGGLAALYLWMRRPVHYPSNPKYPPVKLLRQTAAHSMWLLPDNSIKVKRLRDGAVSYVEPGNPLYKQLSG